MALFRGRPGLAVEEDRLKNKTPAIFQTAGVLA